MQRIHRRKNQEIVKDFVCTYGCGKAYGSYAALYTHMKNKHPNMNILSELKSTMAKPKATGRKGRPLKKQKEEAVVIEVQNEFDCRICQDQDCVCDEEMANQEIERSIMVMQDQRFVDFINCVGAMNIGDSFTWVRNTQEDFTFMSCEEVRNMVFSFIKDYELTKSIKFSESWIDFLSFSSRYWDKRYVKELYNTAFLARSYQNIQDIRIFINNHLQFQNMRKCAELKAKQFNTLIEIVKG